MPAERWCLEPESNRHARFHEAADFKSAVSTCFTIEAAGDCDSKRQERRIAHRCCAKRNSPGTVVQGL